MKRIIPLLFLIISSCYTQKITTMKSILDPYLNQSEQEVKLKWGAPMREMPDGAKGKIIVYESTGSVSSGYYYKEKFLIPDTYIGRSDHYTVNTVSYVQFYIDSTGIVYHYNSNYPNRVERVPNENWDSTAIVVTICSAVLAAWIASGFIGKTE